MGFAVFHVEKGKGSGGGLTNHIDRVEGKEYTYPHADPERKHLNQTFRVPGDRHSMTINKAVEDRISEGYNGKRKIRNDAVKHLNHVYTGSHEDMKRIFADEDKKAEWLKANYAFVCKEFGKENIVRLTLHMDEKTPHLHVVTVPLTSDGRLSAKEVMGNKQDMQLRQDRYAEMMKPFGLERGLKRTGIKHEDAKDYYARMNKAIENGVLESDLTAKRSVLGLDIGIDKEKTIENLKSALIDQKRVLKAKDLELEQTRNKLEVVKNSANNSFVNYQNVLFNDKFQQELQARKIDEMRKKLELSVKIKVNDRFNLHKLNQIDRAKMALDTALDKARKLGMTQSMYSKAMTEDFKYNLVKIADDRAAQNQERDQGRSRGYSR